TAESDGSGEFLENGGGWMRVGRRGMLVRSTMHKLMAVAVIAVVGASGVLVVSPMSAAGAATGPQCAILTVAPASLPATGGTVTVTGTGPVGVGTVHMELFVNGSIVAAQDVASGAPFSLSAVVVPPAGATSISVSVNYTSSVGNAYVGGCADANGATVLSIRVEAAQASKAAALAYTGSSNTPSYVLIGVAALVLGFVLVVAARRRSRANA
ncbi:MAG: LPXTG cell wall anchor domain-containing protein, partial [Acidimicrobiia bacterium]